MKKGIIFIFLTVILINSIFAVPITSHITKDNSVKNNIEENIQTNTNNQESKNQIKEKNIPDNAKQIQKQEQKRIRELDKEEIKNIIQERKRLRIRNQSGECPENCTCTGSVIKCRLQNGQREMTIRAGKSGNVIFQVKGVSTETKVELYQSDGKIYGVFKNNKTKRIRIMPDQIKEKIQQRLRQKECDCEKIELNEDGVYRIQAKKRARLFGLFPVRERVKIEVDAETGEVIKTKASWWGFLAKDEIDEEILVGGNCGTVSPDSRDECCQNKGYDAFDSEKGECIFVE